MTQQISILRLPEVIARTGLSRSTIYAFMASGAFPRQVPLGSRAVGWAENDINSWIQSKVDRAQMSDPQSGVRP